MIVTYPLHQLGNCLRNVLSAKILANYNNRNFEINLKKTRPECAKILQIMFPSNCTYDDRQRTSEKVNNGKHTNFNLIDEGRVEIKDSEVFEVQDSIYSFIPSGMDEKLFLNEKITIYKTLLPKFNFVEPNGIDSWIGVHIRYGDNLKEKSKRHLNTHFSEFKNKLEQQSGKILLCTDNENVRSLLPSTFLKPETLYEGALQGLYEMWLLSRCSKIIGSTSSTFSYESAFFKGSEIELFEDGTWIMYDLRSSQCVVKK